MPKVCFVPMCATGYEAERKRRKAAGERPLSLFSVPKDPHVLLVWESLIKREDRRLKKGDFVCELHFKETDICKFFETKLPDGTINRIERQRPILIEGTNPSIFKFRPLPKPRKPPLERTAPEPHSLVPEHDSQMNCVCPLVPPGDSVSHQEFMEVEPVALEADAPLSSQQTLIELLHQRSPHKWCTTRLPDGCLMAMDVSLEDHSIRKRIVIDGAMKTLVYFGNVPVKMDVYSTIATQDQFQRFFEEIEKMKLCPNAFNKNSSDKHSCMGYHLKGVSCTACSVNRNRRNSKPKKEIRRPVTDDRRKQKRLVKKLIKRKATLDVVKTRMRKISKKDKFALSLEKLPSSQREVVLTILRSAKREKKGMRYSRKYLLDSLLLKIKSSRAYHFLRRRNILPLPAPSTLAKKIQHMKPGFGFREETFAAMQKKGEGLSPNERRGVLILDEMKIAPSVRFSKSELKVIGFTDLGEYTPSGQTTELGDHALVLMFQPFQGKWVQAIAPFLSKGAARGDVLSQLVMEGVLLLEKAGFFVDGVVCNGASWNRKMWEVFGVCEQTPWATHPADEKRRLFFLSDFCHLIKNLWTGILKTNAFSTPDGIVKRSHWEVVVEEELKRRLRPRASLQLNETHIRPKQYQKMSVARAYKFFSREVEAAMSLYQQDSRVNGLADAQPTLKFMRKISDLIKAFSARSMKGAIFRDCEEKKAIVTFIEYLDGIKEAMSNQTLYGFKITCRAALELIDFLLNDCNFIFVMTARFNQDNLERFFGMIRGACGHGDHPDPIMFSHIYKLMSTYSLVRPPPGSNVNSEELFDSLLTVDQKEEASGSHERWEKIRTQITGQLEKVDGDSIKITCGDVDSKILEYVAGRVAERVGRFKKCEECAASAISPENSSPTSLIAIKNYHGVLKNPSLPLHHLIQMVEQLITDRMVSLKSLSPDSFFEIAEALEDLPIPEVGCPNHKEEVTPNIVKYYITMRLHFITEEATRSLTNKKSSELRKMGKLMSWSLGCDLVQFPTRLANSQKFPALLLSPRKCTCLILVL